MTDNKDKNPTTTRENARARTNPKTIKERIKSLTRRHTHTGNDRRTPLKLKKAGQDPIISALEEHEPRAYPPVERATSKINPWRIPTEPKKSHSALAAQEKAPEHIKNHFSLARADPSTYPGHGELRRKPLIKRLFEKAKSAINSHIHIDNDWSAPVRIEKSSTIKQLRESGRMTYSDPMKKPGKPMAHHIKKAAERAKHHAKNHFSFERNNLALEYLSAWEHKYHKTLHILSFLIPIMILGYVIYMNILPFGYTGNLILNVGAEADMDETKDIYLSDPNKALTLIQRYGKDTFRVVKKNEPFHIIFNSPINLDEKTRVTMDIDHEGDSPLYIEYFDPALNQTIWKRYYKDDYKPEEDGYILVASFPDNMIYAKESVVQQKCRRLNSSADCSIETIKSSARQYFKHNTTAMMNPTPESAINWLMDNAKYDSVLFLSEDVDTRNIPNPVDYHEGEWTEIDADLRKYSNFYVYLNNTLNLTITKKDYNWYNGSDEVPVELYDLNNTLIFHDIIPDDGIINEGKKTSPVVKTMTCEVKEGTYLLKLNYVRDASASPDYYIDKIRINTNKIVTTGTVLPVSETTLYTNANDMSKISLKYWHSGKDQDIIVKGDNSQIIKLTKDDISKNVRKTISGKNTLYFPKGDLYIFSNLYFSFNESNYFEPYVFGINDNQVPQYIVYGGTYKSWIYTKNNISLKSSNLRINNIKMVFKHV